MRRQRKCFEKRKNFSYQAQMGLTLSYVEKWCPMAAKDGVTFQRNNLKHKIIVDKLLNHYHHHPPSQVFVTDSRAVVSKADQAINTPFIQNMHCISSQLSTKLSMKLKKTVPTCINNMSNVSSCKMRVNVHLEALQNSYHCGARVFQVCARALLCIFCVIDK